LALADNNLVLYEWAKVVEIIYFHITAKISFYFRLIFVFLISLAYKIKDKFHLSRNTIDHETNPVIRFFLD